MVLRKVVSKPVCSRGARGSHAWVPAVPGAVRTEPAATLDVLGQRGAAAAPWPVFTKIEPVLDLGLKLLGKIMVFTKKVK